MFPELYNESFAQVKHDGSKPKIRLLWVIKKPETGQ